MKRILVLVLLFAGSTGAFAQSAETSPENASTVSDFLSGVRAAIQKHLGRPYVWGATGAKSFDCSGFVWRVMLENGVLVKRTTARKFYMMTKPVPKGEEWTFGTLVFFDNLKHIGIVDDSKAFYHAQVSRGTNRSEMNSFWRKKIYGFRRFPVPENP